MPQEFTESRPDIENHIVLADIALKEMTAQHLPDGVLRLSLLVRKAGDVDGVQFHSHRVALNWEGSIIPMNLRSTPLVASGLTCDDQHRFTARMPGAGGDAFHCGPDGGARMREQLERVMI